MNGAFPCQLACSVEWPALAKMHFDVTSKTSGQLSFVSFEGGDRNARRDVFSWLMWSEATEKQRIYICKGNCAPKLSKSPMHYLTVAGHSVRSRYNVMSEGWLAHGCTEKLLRLFQLAWKQRETTNLDIGRHLIGRANRRSVHAYWFEKPFPPGDCYEWLQSIGYFPAIQLRVVPMHIARKWKNPSSWNLHTAQNLVRIWKNRHGVLRTYDPTDRRRANHN